MAKIYILDLQPVITSVTNNLEGNNTLHELTLQETANISGGAGLTPAEGLTYGTAVLSAGIGVIAIATGPVGWVAGGFLYGAGFVLAAYSGYLVGGGGSSRLTGLR